jgi:hypothetical protein
MKRLCSGCAEKHVYIARAVSPEQYEGKLKGHDLCGKCYRSFRSSDHAARMTPKPFFAERHSLGILAAQAMKAEARSQ